MDTVPASQTRKVKALSLHSPIILVIGIAIIAGFCFQMGINNFFKTVMETAFSLLKDTVLKIMALAVLAGALGALLNEFGILALLNKLLAPVVRLLWGLPGAASIAAISTYLSDNPAVIPLAKDQHFIKYFHPYQRPALTNFGTSFGMGLVLTTFMMTLGDGFWKAALIGNIGAIVGSIVSTRLMLRFSRKHFHANGYAAMLDDTSANSELFRYREVREGSVFQRCLDAISEGGKTGVDMGLAIIPGVLVICTVIMLIINDAGADHVYSGEAFEGIPLLPTVGQWIAEPMRWLFGFQNPAKAIAFPITALGAVGATFGLTEGLVQQNMVSANDIAVFTAMGMCWSGYLSTHVAMMDALGFRSLTIKAITAHTFGGLAAGISAHWIFVLLQHTIGL